MGENEGMTWILLAFVGLLVIGLQFAETFDIDAHVWFRGVTYITTLFI